MAHFSRKITKKIFIAATVALVSVFLAACCNSFLNPARYWYIAVLGVGFPLLTFALVCLVFFWLVFRSRWALLPLAALLAGWVQVKTFFAFHPHGAFSSKKAAGNIRIMQWNVSSLGLMNKKSVGVVYRQKILNYIAKMHPDVLCMQEFLESDNPVELEYNIPYLTKVLGYPYHYFARDHMANTGYYEQGVAIFSRFPIVDTLRLRYETSDPKKPGESLIHADISVNGGRLRIFTTHLQSLRFNEEDYEVLHTITRAKKGALHQSKDVLHKFRMGYQSRSRQAELVRRELDASPYPGVLCGDFNDIPNSYTYFRVRGDWNDAFLEKGFGIGRSFYSLSPTLRIDYILGSKELEATQFKNTPLPYSDHYPLVADFKLPAGN